VTDVGAASDAALLLHSSPDTSLLADRRMDSKQMQINWLNVLTGGSAVLLVGTEAAVVTEAAAWAASGLLRLTPQITLALYVSAAIVALLLTAAFALMVHRTEPFFTRASAPAFVRSGSETHDVRSRGGRRS
jgi:hypothetical protein